MLSLQHSVKALYVYEQFAFTVIKEVRDFNQHETSKTSTFILYQDRCERDSAIFKHSQGVSKPE